MSHASKIKAKIKADKIKGDKIKACFKSRPYISDLFDISESN